MPNLPVLFPVDALRPSTRDVAIAVKAGGLAALPDAQRRADEARYQEVSCRSALNRVEGMPFRWTLNPYRGCTHGCHYCFARRYHAQFELGAGDEFATVILVKRNVVGVLRRELAKPSWTRELVAVGTATDPYQPIEGQYQLTRQSLAALAAAATPAGIVTKGPMIVRDIDVLQELSAKSACRVYVSVPSVDEDAWRKLEPGTAHPLQRLRAVRTLTDAGIQAGVLMAPLLPGITTHPRMLARTVAAVADHGAAFVGANLLYLEGGTRTHFLGFLEREYPQLVDGYHSLYAGGKRATPAYAAEVMAMVRRLQGRAGLARSTSQDTAGVKGESQDVRPRHADAQAPAAPAQPAFVWE